MQPLHVPVRGGLLAPHYLLWVRNRGPVRSDHLPLTGLFHENIGDVPSEPMLAGFVSETDTLASLDYGSIAVNAHARVVDDVLQRPIPRRPEVCVSRRRIVISFHATVASGRYLEILSSSPTLPSSTSIITAVAVNAFARDRG